MEKKNTSQEAKKVWETPVLMVHGDVEKITSEMPGVRPGFGPGGS